MRREIDMVKNKEQSITNKENIKDLPVCFVIMPFTDPDNYDKGHFKKIYEQIFVPAINNAGYKPDRVDENNASNSIQIKLLKKLLDADVVLCDLSTRNPNVLYELGLRQAFDKPVVLVQEVGTPRIFDINDITCKDYRSERRYDEVLEDQKMISESIKATIQSTSKTDSVMKLLKMSSATIDNTEVSKEDKIQFMLNKMMSQISELRATQEDQEIQRRNNKKIFALNYDNNDLGCRITNFYNRIINSTSEEIIDNYIQNNEEFDNLKIMLKQNQTISVLDQKKLRNLLHQIDNKLSTLKYQDECSLPF